jgi:hypothetical protein
VAMKKIKNLERRYHFEDLGTDGRIILKCVLNECGVTVIF